MDPRAGEHRYEVEAEGEYVLVRCVGRMASAAEAQEMQRKIEQALERTNLRTVIVDNRETSAPVDEARESMWTWCRECAALDRLALLLENEMARVRANMTAVSGGARVRAFASVEDAAVWLLRGPTQRQAQG